jgi:beta-lactamase superfamily II metal-dependent hydrolase
VSVLFCGDLEANAQQELLDRGLDVRADIFRVCDRDFAWPA